MNKKIISLGLSIILGLGMLVGCGKDEEVVQEDKVVVEETQPQEEQQERYVEPQEQKDESLNDEVYNGEYSFEEEYEEDKTEMAYEMLKYVCSQSLSDIDYDLYIYEENVIVLDCHLPKNTIYSANVNSWNQLANSQAEFSGCLMGTEYEEVSFIIAISDENGDCYLMAKDGEVVFDVVNGIDFRE